MNVTAEQIDRAARSVMEQLNAPTPFTDSHPDAEDDQQTYADHLLECSVCQMAEAMEESKHAQGFVRVLVWQHAQGDLVLVNALVAAMAFGIRIGAALPRGPEEQADQSAFDDEPSFEQFQQGYEKGN